MDSASLVMEVAVVVSSTVATMSPWRSASWRVTVPAWSWVAARPPSMPVMLRLQAVPVAIQAGLSPVAVA
ncbi:hypothetical protein BL253_00035 [Pseudofrankia asymbiotica]|uniref:Uncharacterized protein n=1 Tax=Pseudofrankia asymbiotica TaxID=1834516 RepID=A0A1V2IL44_9ACTN|nr:hypothetical protein BL253_00035 [Pseudofrankia asymbiotica]